MGQVTILFGFDVGACVSVEPSHPASRQSHLCSMKYLVNGSITLSVLAQGVPCALRSLHQGVVA